MIFLYARTYKLCMFDYKENILFVFIIVSDISNTNVFRFQFKHEKR